MNTPGQQRVPPAQARPLRQVGGLAADRALVAGVAHQGDQGERPDRREPVGEQVEQHARDAGPVHRRGRR